MILGITWVFLYFDFYTLRPKLSLGIESYRKLVMKSLFRLFCSFLVLLLLVTGDLHGQSPIPLSANEHVTVTIFFPSNVIRVVPPAVNFKFEYDTDTNIGLLRGRRGNPSNLTVITENGYIYSFALQYADEVLNFNYILSQDQAIGSTNGKANPKPLENEAGGEQQVLTSRQGQTVEPEITENGNENQGNAAIDLPIRTLVPEDTVTTVLDTRQTAPTETASYERVSGGPMAINSAEDDLYMVDREEYYRIFCENNYLQKTIFKRSFRQSKKVILKLNNILEDRSEIYFVLQIENNSKKDYKVNGLSFFKELGVGELQKIMTPLYTFNLQDTIDAESINEVVYVFRNFKLSNKEKVHVVLDELEDNRMVKLPLDYNHINYPSN